MAKSKVKSREERLQEAWLKYFKNIQKENELIRVIIDYADEIDSKYMQLLEYNTKDDDDIYENKNLKKIKENNTKKNIEIHDSELRWQLSLKVKNITRIEKEIDSHSEYTKNQFNEKFKKFYQYRKILQEIQKQTQEMYLYTKLKENNFNSLYLKNFKGFSEINDTIDNTIQIKPITLIYGPNSFGKSSILQSLLLLNQTVNEGGDHRTVCLLPKGEMVNLGIFQDLINKNAKNQEIIIELGLPPNHYFEENNTELQETSILTELFFAFHFVLDEKQIIMPQIDVYGKQTDYSNPLKPISKEKELIYTYKLKDRSNGIYEKKCKIKNSKNEIEEISKLSFFRLEEFIAGKPFEQLEDIIKDIVYVSSFRQPPERYYVPENNKRRYVGKNGEYTAEIIYDPDVHNYIDDWLYKIAKYKLSSKNMDTKVNSITLNDGTATNVTKINLLDLGSGIAQVLPIITQAFKSENDMILIEEPEIHLHPKAQAELGEMFAKAAEDKNNTFIIETHSENLLLRLQKKIRHGELAKDDVSVIYVNKDDKGSHCIPLEIDDEGDIINIDDVPDGFFEEGFDELFDIKK